jgi:hypothetical protein
MKNRSSEILNADGMAIPMVLGFILVATILGSTLIFMTRTKGADVHRTVSRFQHIHVTQIGLIEALAIIKPMRMNELISKRGTEWELKVAPQAYGTASGWSVVKVKTRGSGKLEISSTGYWQDKNSEPVLRNLSCLATYEESLVTTEGRYGTNVNIQGSWKVDRFKEDRLKSDFD